MDFLFLIKTNILMYHLYCKIISSAIHVSTLIGNSPSQHYALVGGM